MKNVRLLLLNILFCILGSTSVSGSDIDRICLSACISENESLPEESAKLLYNKLQQIITANGFADNEYVYRFILTAKINILNKDIVTGPPQRISQTLEITFYIGDIDSDKAFQSMSMEITGIGTSVNKSFINAIKQIKPCSAQFAQFMSKGKVAIIEYYTLHTEEMISVAKQMASTENYSRALDILTTIPNVNAAQYETCGHLIEDYYHKMIEADGNRFFNLAQSCWSANPTREGAKQATEYLKQINPLSSIQPQAYNLAEEITDRMTEIDNREWKQRLQEYKDDIEREKRRWKQRMEQARQEHERGMARDAQKAATHSALIQAYRDVAIERAKNQPKVINFNKINIW